MGYKSFADYDVHEVAVWVHAIGMGDRAQAFVDNGVDGKLLVDLSIDDLKTDLGFPGLHAKKFLQKLDFALELTTPRGDGTDDAEALLAELQAANAGLKKQLDDLKSIKANLIGPAQVPVYHATPPMSAPAPAHAPAPPPQNKRVAGGVVKGAAFGAAGGAAKGAIVGAIVPGMSARDGAKAGAAVGGLKGGVRGGIRRLR